jgi:release factor glutamine methyltransferase
MNDRNVLQEEAWLLRDKYHGERTPAYEVDCERLRRGEPLAYVIGWVSFLNTRIHLDSYPLIPRPETEHWVEKAIAKMPESPLQVLDLCAGSGAIGVTVAKARSEARVDFAELDATHHRTIIDNVCNNGIEFSLTRVFGGNLFEHIPVGTTYHYILSNPPYIDPSLDRTDENVKTHEPHLALYGGEEGFEIIANIIRTARSYMKAGGELWIEHEPEQEVLIEALARQCEYSVIRSERDQFGLVRYSVLTR